MFKELFETKNIKLLESAKKIFDHLNIDYEEITIDKNNYVHILYSSKKDRDKGAELINKFIQTVNNSTFPTYPQVCQSRFRKNLVWYTGVDWTKLVNKSKI